HNRTVTPKAAFDIASKTAHVAAAGLAIACPACKTPAHMRCSHAERPESRSGTAIMIRLIGYLFGLASVLALGVAAVVAVYLGNVSKDLPDYAVLSSYEPPVTTRFHAGNGALMAEYARERRLFLPIQAIPD